MGLRADIEVSNFYNIERLKKVLTIKPVGGVSEKIYKRREHVLLGISPFNSYFSEGNLIRLFSWAISNFDRFNIFVPNKISVSTFLALGYSQEKAEFKTRRQDSYLINKIFRALKKLGYDESYGSKTLVKLSALFKNSTYNNLYNYYIAQFEQNNEFRRGCLSTSSWVLSKKQKNLAEDNIIMAVHYFLREFPLFIDTPRILDVDSSLFVYHSIPVFLKSLYLEKEMISQKQGFLEVQLNDYLTYKDNLDENGR